MANDADPDQMTCSAVSDLDLHSFLVRILKANTVFKLLIIFKLMSTALDKKSMKFFCLFVCFFYLHRKTYGYSDIKSTLAKHFLLVGRGTSNSNEYSRFHAEIKKCLHFG